MRLPARRGAGVAGMVRAVVLDVQQSRGKRFGQDAPAANATEKMRQKLRTATGKVLYAARKHIVEPVFGQIKSARGIRKFLLRGLEKVSAEWQLICLTHNILKIWRRASVGATS